MSVFTRVSPEQLSAWLEGYALGALCEMQGIAEGVENTNYFVTTGAGRYVLTLFERLQQPEVSFCLGLMAHLAARGIPCPAPLADRDGALCGRLAGRPAALVSRLDGAAVASPDPRHCAAVGDALARMHLAARDFPGTRDNPRGPRWWDECAPRVSGFLDARRGELLDSELRYQRRQRHDALPRGPIHADLFRDNALFGAGPGAPLLSGVLDFYFAGTDVLLLDCAVAVNDWCIDAGGRIDAARSAALLAAYARVRPFADAERLAWPALLRAAALRFWLSRLDDFWCPRPGVLTHAHDPEHFRRILELRRDGAYALP